MCSYLLVLLHSAALFLICTGMHNVWRLFDYLRIVRSVCCVTSEPVGTCDRHKCVRLPAIATRVLLYVTCFLIYHSSCILAKIIAVSSLCIRTSHVGLVFYGYMRLNNSLAVVSLSVAQNSKITCCSLIRVMCARSGYSF